MRSEVEALKRYRIGVLAGGPSSEREISLASGMAVFGTLKETGIDARLIDVEEESFSSVMDRTDINLAFIALHGRFGEDGTVQKELGRRGIPYTGSGPESSRLALDKLSSKKKFEEEGLSVPPYTVMRAGAARAPFDMRPPLVIKPRREGSSIGLTVVRSEDSIRSAVSKAARFDGEIIIEEFVPGREITVGMLEERPLPVVEIIAAGGVYDFEAKYRSKDTEYVIPARLDKEDYRRAQEAGMRAHAALGCEGFSRVDLRLSDEGKIFVLEVNTIPGLTERSLLPMAAKAAGLDFLRLCVKMLCGALSKGG